MGISQMILLLWNVLLRRISQNEFTEIDTFTRGGHMPAGPIWSIPGVSVSTNSDTVSTNGVRYTNDAIMVSHTFA